MRCHNCNKKAGINTLECKHCCYSFCISCYTPEKHKCVKIDEFISKYKLELSKQLLNNVCKADKVEDRI
jgi:hypothetical protein